MDIVPTCISHQSMREVLVVQENNLVPRVYSAFKMAAEGGEDLQTSSAIIDSCNR